MTIARWHSHPLLWSSGLTDPINVDPFRRKPVSLVPEPTRIINHFLNREPSRNDPVATYARTETHPFRIWVKTRKHPEMTTGSKGAYLPAKCSHYTFVFYCVNSLHIAALGARPTGLPIHWSGNRPMQLALFVKQGFDRPNIKPLGLNVYWRTTAFIMN